MSGDFKRLADRLAARIADGTLRPGERLPPQREFARREGIAPSTASRVYAELIRRGLAVGEVGRGTFVRAAAPGAEPALVEPGRARVDLELNFPLLPGQTQQVTAGLQRLLRAEALEVAMRPATALGEAGLRSAAAALLSRGGWSAEPDRMLFAAGGRQAIAAALAALVPTGERLGVERFTYPVIKGIAARLGITLVPLAVDEEGLLPQAVADALPLRAVYCQPALHNPLGTTMSPRRRAELVEVLRRHELRVVEDGIYGFLRPELPPLAALAPERTVLVDSLSKRVAPGLSVGFLHAPDEPLRAALAAALRTGGWAAARFALEATGQWLTDGTAAALGEAKRADAAARQRIRAERLAGFRVRADPAAYHCWWELPAPWRADTFVAAAARLGIALTPAAAFAVGPAHAPAAVRLALASPPHPVLADALDTLAALAHGTPEDSGGPVE
mgnify:CR=1 FL=1